MRFPQGICTRFWGSKKVEIEGVPPPSEIRAEILRRAPVWMPQMVGMATHLVAKRCDLGFLGVPGLASMFGGQTSWLARMFGLCQDDIILAEANIMAYAKV